ncbi:peroxisomal membrane protein PEX14-like isoform X2 [Phragmites australis]|uniref:peroxisomal membrane protein PEX14-like isoform X2 n=1 Tax=Phragmites australis TaxID=29695 RepID=UPI002D77F2AD|nr:peroxisomal membrane protein PEX14-like isoform X2 [Phragmites australis]XP_062179812.1 peroxisomal membrane protein PEX14-like isoform X2 [Phragmites australis]
MPSSSSPTQRIRNRVLPPLLPHSSKNQSTSMQTYAPVQSLQPATSPATADPVVLRPQPKFSWYQAFLAAGLLLGFGASASVFIKKLFLPRLKSWIRNVVAGGDETEGKEPKTKIEEETAEAVKASASAVSAIAKTNQELLASKDEGFTILSHDLFHFCCQYIHSVVVLMLAEKKILVTLMQALDSQAKELKSLRESLNHSRESINISREDRFSQYRPLEEHAPPAIRNGQLCGISYFSVSLFASNSSVIRRAPPFVMAVLCKKHLHANPRLEKFALWFQYNC